jgi:hypothetical protein
VREFECIGVSPPQDHPHIYINLGEADTILCPYCGTRFHFDPRLTPLDADPPDSLFDEDDPLDRTNGQVARPSAATERPGIVYQESLQSRDVLEPRVLHPTGFRLRGAASAS